MQTFKEFHAATKLPVDLQKKRNRLDTIQAALDIAGFEPSIGTGADVINVIISGLRAAASKESDERKRHLLNAGISAISLVPFADVIKIIKLKHISRPLTRAAIRGARASRAYAKSIKQQDNRYDNYS